MSPSRSPIFSSRAAFGPDALARAADTDVRDAVELNAALHELITHLRDEVVATEGPQGLSPRLDDGQRHELLRRLDEKLQQAQQSVRERQSE